MKNPTIFSVALFSVILSGCTNIQKEAVVNITTTPQTIISKRPLNENEINFFEKVKDAQILTKKDIEIDDGAGTIIVYKDKREFGWFELAINTITGELLDSSHGVRDPLTDKELLAKQGLALSGGGIMGNTCFQVGAFPNEEIIKKVDRLVVTYPDGISKTEDLLGSTAAFISTRENCDIYTDLKVKQTFFGFDSNVLWEQ